MSYRKQSPITLLDYGFLKFDDNLQNYEVTDFNDDLKLIIKYNYCNNNPKINLKIYSNSRKAFNKALKKLNCNDMP
jgi:hypothetical protein